MSAPISKNPPPLPAGMDNPWYDYAPYPKRPKLNWPRNARVAFYVVLHLEYFELLPPDGVVKDSRFTGEFGVYHPDYRTWTQREYGNRTGIFRVLDVLDRYQIRALDGRLVPLSQVARVVAGVGPAAIEHVGRERSVMVYATTLPGASTAQLIQTLDRTADSLDMPPSYSTALTGQAREFGKAARGFAIAMGLRPEQGIIAGALACVVGRTFGGSKYQVYGPTAAFIPVVAGLMTKYGAEGGGTFAQVLVDRPA